MSARLSVAGFAGDSRAGQRHAGDPGPVVAANEVHGATETPEERGLQRDEVRLLVSSKDGHRHGGFLDLPDLLEAGDVLVVNDSATLPAALPAYAANREFLLHLSTRFGPRLWLAEPRYAVDRPGPLPFPAGQPVTIAGARARMLGSYPGIPRLRFVRFDADPAELISSRGRPIRYGYLDSKPNLDAYQTVFAARPGSAEMPSAARPFSGRVVGRLAAAGVSLVRLTLHTGVSSLESADLEGGVLYPEPFAVPAASAGQLNEAIAQARRLIAVGTTAVRALTSAWDGSMFRAARGMTNVRVGPETSLPPLSGLLTGFHEPGATHLSLLDAVAGKDLVEDAYRQAVGGGYLWHEFGDVHLLIP